MRFESSWIVWLKDTAAALMIGTACDHEEVKSCIVVSPPLVSPAIILSTDFTITFRFVLHSQTKTLETVTQRMGLLDISEQAESILHSLRWHSNLLFNV